MVRFEHHRLRVYGKALSMAVVADGIRRRLPLSHRHLRDQLARASTSVVLNIAEGASEYSTRDKARFYRLALRSAAECAAVLELATRLKLLQADDVRDGMGLLHETVALLTTMAKRPIRWSHSPSPSPSPSPRDGAGKGVP